MSDAFLLGIKFIEEGENGLEEEEEKKKVSIIIRRQQ
jgi:hypothetical protein